MKTKTKTVALIAFSLLVILSRFSIAQTNGEIFCETGLYGEVCQPEEWCSGEETTLEGGTLCCEFGSCTSLEEAFPPESGRDPESEPGLQYEGSYMATPTNVGLYTLYGIVGVISIFTLIFIIIVWTSKRNRKK